jgi:hypothetical protein
MALQSIVIIVMLSQASLDLQKRISSFRALQFVWINVRKKGLQKICRQITKKSEKFLRWQSAERDLNVISAIHRRDFHPQLELFLLTREPVIELRRN